MPKDQLRPYQCNMRVGRTTLGLLDSLHKATGLSRASVFMLVREKAHQLNLSVSSSYRPRRPRRTA
jgi:hypothetical protein